MIMKAEKQTGAKKPGKTAGKRSPFSQRELTESIAMLEKALAARSNAPVETRKNILIQGLFVP